MTCLELREWPCIGGTRRQQGRQGRNGRTSDWARSPGGRVLNPWAVGSGGVVGDGARLTFTSLMVMVLPRCVMQNNCMLLDAPVGPFGFTFGPQRKRC